MGKVGWQWACARSIALTPVASSRRPITSYVTGRTDASTGKKAQTNPQDSNCLAAASHPVMDATFYFAIRRLVSAKDVSAHPPKNGIPTTRQQGCFGSGRWSEVRKKKYFDGVPHAVWVFGVEDYV